MSRPFPKSSARPPRDAGTTLLELVVALALFSTVALIGMQALRPSLPYQEDLSRASAQMAELDYAIGLLRHDFESAQSLAPRRSANAAALPLRLVGVPQLGALGQSTQVDVLWSYDAVRQQLNRHHLSDLTPNQTPPVLSGVLDFEFGVLTGQGWESPQTGIAAPRAYEVRLRTDRGPLRILVVK